MAQYSDVTIGGLFPVSLYVNIPELHFRAKPDELRCTGFDFRAFRWLQTMIFTIGEINKEARILPNITLGYRVYDTCDIYSLRAAMTFLSGAGEHMSNSTCKGAVSVPAIIGEAGSLQSSIIASTTGPFQVPIISYFATCTCLSDRHRYPAFFRTAPSDYFQTKALAQLVKHFGWTWIGAFVNDDDYGRFGIQQFQEQVTEFGACIAFSYILPKIYNAAKISQMVNVIKRSSAKVIVVFTPEREMLQLIEEVARQNVTGIQWLASEAWITGAVLFTGRFLPYLEGAIGFSFRRAEIPGLREFLLRVKPSTHDSDNFVNVFWEELFACKFKLPKNITERATLGVRLCTGSESLEDISTIYSDTSQLRVSYNVYKGVYAIAHALHRLSLCESDKGPFINRSCASIHNFEPWQLLHYLKEVRFTDQFGGEVGFDENGDAIASYDLINWQRGASGNVEYVQVGRFDASASTGLGLSLEEHSIVWTGGKTQPPWSACSESCPRGMRKASRDGEPLCCFDCVPCADGEISNETDSVECTKCSSDDWSNADRTMCIPREIEYLSFEDGTGITFAIIALLGACLTVAVLAVFFRHRDTPVVKANNSELSFLLLNSLVMCFLCSLAFIGRPTAWSCMLRHTAFGIIFVLCISCILAKTVVVLMAFRATLPNSNVMKWFGATQQRAVIFLCTCVQVGICVTWLVRAPPFPIKNTAYQSAKTILECHVGSVVAFYTVLAYVSFLSCICFVLAFLARKLPDNFNEAKFITFSMLIFFAVWIAFIPAYVSSPGIYTVAVEIFAILSSSFGLLLCIFAPKCFIILLRPEQNTKKMLMSKH
ncbi:extracellular calcium-sensing receptor-like [Carcharodon carcharias]|uniref:extracellular calcium-sensing receptor-like n=1 Tax=Carcharodon carcharias TaxID=13397 RepID=UPI001B7F6A86|nr:extracellular calcium-sensing receptor-like [Carcharodon carcharias]